MTRATRGHALEHLGRTLFVAALLLAASSSTLAKAGEPAEMLFCNLKALTPAERSEHDLLTRRLFAAVAERHEIATGIELRVDRSKVSILDLARWIEAEKRCCAFLRLAIEQEPHDGPLWLRLTGPEGVKDFLAAEFEDGQTTQKR